MTTIPSCPGHDALQHFSLGQVRESEASNLEAHLAGCPGCVATLHDLGGEDTLVDAMRAQVGLKERPPINEAVMQLMVVLKGLTPTGSPSTATDTVADQDAAQDLIALLAPPEQPDELGRLGPYRILNVLGAGGMGVVFEAEDPQLKRKVALKAIRPQLAVSGKARKRFEREGRAAAAISHENVITIYEVGEERGIPFLAMQSLSGETLQARLRRQGPLPLAEILDIGRQLAEGLSAAHAQGLLHRDVKPANIFLETAGSKQQTADSKERKANEGLPAACCLLPAIRVKLLDFGLAWAADESGPLTESGVVVGTPSYMAPEQARGEPADIRSDLFSLGSVLYAMCTGRAPFESDSNFATLEKVRTESAKPIAEINPAIPQWLADLVAKLHAKDRDQRCSSAAEVAALLQQPSQPSQPTADSRRPVGQAFQPDCQAGKPDLRIRTARRWWAAAAALLVLPVLGLTLCEATGMTRLHAFVASLRQQPEPPKIVENDDKPEPKDPPRVEAAPAPPIKEQPAKPEEPKPVEAAPTVYPAALFAFEERGASGLGAKVADILFAKLAAREELHLVDRNDLHKILGELELNISGVVKPSEANKIGQLTGAKILISGSVISVDKKIILVAKIVGTETSRVFAASVDGRHDDELAPLVDKLAAQVADVISKKADQIVAKTPKKVDRIAELNTRLKGKKRPSVMVTIKERHIGPPALDPAAQTEIAKFLKETGFTVIDDEASRSKADIVITGEAFSEVASRNGRLISVKARVEIKATNRADDTILVADRQTALVIDLAEQNASKGALEEAAAILAERVLPKLVKE